MEKFDGIPTSEKTLERIRARVSAVLSEKRAAHTFFVEKEALTLAETLFLVYNIDDAFKNDIRAAALLHDLTKECSMDEQLALCEKYGIDPGTHPSGAVLHGRTAAYLAREEFHVGKRVFWAVFRHTTGAEVMTVADKLLFLADYIEPSRSQTKCKEARAYFYGELEKRGAKEALAVLDEACLMSLNGTLAYLLEKGNIIDLETVKARNAFLAQNVCVRP